MLKKIWQDLEQQFRALSGSLGESVRSNNPFWKNQGTNCIKQFWLNWRQYDKILMMHLRRSVNRSCYRFIYCKFVKAPRIVIKLLVAVKKVLIFWRQPVGASHEWNRDLWGLERAEKNFCSWRFDRNRIRKEASRVQPGLSSGQIDALFACVRWLSYLIYLKCNFYLLGKCVKRESIIRGFWINCLSI